jgi:hypothetical protein
VIVECEVCRDSPIVQTKSIVATLPLMRILRFEHIWLAMPRPKLVSAASVAASMQTRLAIGACFPSAETMVISHSPGLRLGRSSRPAACAAVIATDAPARRHALAARVRLIA